MAENRVYNSVEGRALEGQKLASGGESSVGKGEGVAMAAHGVSGNSAASQAWEAKQAEAGGDTSIQTLAGNGLLEVPSRFIRSESERISFSPHSTMSLEPIPMIDLEGLHDYRRQFTMAAISSACRHWGCFQA